MPLKIGPKQLISFKITPDGVQNVVCGAIFNTTQLHEATSCSFVYLCLHIDVTFLSEMMPRYRVHSMPVNFFFFMLF